MGAAGSCGAEDLDEEPICGWDGGCGNADEDAPPQGCVLAKTVAGSNACPPPIRIAAFPSPHCDRFRHQFKTRLLLALLGPGSGANCFPGKAELTPWPKLQRRSACGDLLVPKTRMVWRTTSWQRTRKATCLSTTFSTRTARCATWGSDFCFAVDFFCIPVCVLMNPQFQ